jgi:hypothetical protein
VPSVITPCGGSGGIKFDTYPQAGNWLYVQTDNEAGSPDGYGLELNDFSAGGAFMGAFGGGDVHLRVNGGGQIYLQSAGDISIAATTVLRLGTFGQLDLSGGGIRIKNEDVGDFAVIGTAGTSLYLRIEEQLLTIYYGGDANTIGNPLLVIDPTGTPSYHILTGATWQADL